MKSHKVTYFVVRILTLLIHAKTPFVARYATCIKHDGIFKPHLIEKQILNCLPSEWKHRDSQSWK